MNENFYVRVKAFYNRGRENMKRRIIVVMFLMCFITMATSLEKLFQEHTQHENMLRKL